MKTKEMKSDRLDYMDLFRGIGIILMVMGHIGFGRWFDYYIHAFNMPMFFFISGFFFKSKPVEELKTMDFIKKKARTLIVPYAFFGSFHYLIWYAITEKKETNPLLHLVSFNTEGLPIAGALWFLTALFFTNIFYFFLNRYIKNNRIRNFCVIGIALLGNAAIYILPFRMPYALDSAMVGVGLFHIAYCMRSKMNHKNVSKLFDLDKWQLIVVGGLVTVLIFVNDSINMRTGDYACIPLFWVNAVTTIVIGINLSRKMLHCKLKFLVPINKYLQDCGEKSIVYLGFNQLAILIVEYGVKYLGLPFVASKIIILAVTMAVLRMCNCVMYNTRIKVFIGK